MRAVVQRVTRASVTVDREVIGAIDHGLLVLLGAGREDTDTDLDYTVRKILGLRIFEDDTGRMNRSVVDANGALLVVSQFTLYGDVRKGRRPSFGGAMDPGPAAAMVSRFVDAARAAGVPVETGRFGADMKVELLNDGPVTLIIDSSRIL